MRGVSGRVETTSAKNPEHGSHGVGRAEPHPGNMLAYRSLRGSASSDHLDLVRGAAALLVMLGHLRNLFFVDFSEVARTPTRWSSWCIWLRASVITR